MVAGQPEVMKSFESQIGALIIDEAHHFLTAVKKMN
jgi:superfamily II DNA or RNA helicase